MFVSGEGFAARKSKEGVPVYEVTENFENPLRCPVKLYEFFLSKWYFFFYFSFLIAYYLISSSIVNVL